MLALSVRRYTQSTSNFSLIGFSVFIIASVRRSMVKKRKNLMAHVGFHISAFMIKELKAIHTTPLKCLLLNRHLRPLRTY